MDKKLSVRNVAALKRTAQNNYPLVAKREKILNQLKELENELESINVQIESAETGSKMLTGGYTSMDLIERQLIPTGKYDANGKEIKMTKYAPKTDALLLNEDGTYSIVLGNSEEESRSLMDYEQQEFNEEND